MRVDSNAVNTGLKSIETAHDLIRKAINNVESASGSLDYRISGKIGGFSGATNSLKSALTISSNVMDKCSEYISDTQDAILFMKSLSPESLADITNSDILGLGKGPLNSDFLSDTDKEAIKYKKGQEEYKIELTKRGYTKKDAEKLINREISSSELYQEIYQEYCNGDTTRFKPLVESALLNSMYFNRDESSKRRTEIETSIEELETGKSITKKESELYKKVVDSAKYDSKTGKYVYKDDDGVVHEFDKKSYDTLKTMQQNAVVAEKAYSKVADAQIKQFKTELKAIDADLSDTSKEDFSYRTVEDMDARILEIDARKKEIDRKISYGHSGADALKNESDELELERKKLLGIKEALKSNTNLILDNAKYTWQPDYEEKIGLNKEKTREITHFDNGGNIVINIFGIEDGKYTFMDSDEYRGALLARMLNGDAKIIPDFQGGALNVVGDVNDPLGSQEFYFYGNERQLLFNEYQDWINASTDKEENEAVVIYPQEKETFNYICNTEGYAAGYKYLKDKESIFDQRFAAIKTVEDEAYARSNPLAGAASIFLSIPEAIVNTGKIITRKSTGQDLHYYDTYSSANTWNSTISSDMHKQNDVLGYVYDTLYSTDRILMSSVASYATGGGSLWSIGVNAALYGAPTFTSSVYNAKTKNIDDDRAIRFALVSATARTLSTSYMLSKATGLENTFNSVLTSGQAMSKINGIVNGSKILSNNPEFSKNLLLSLYCMGTQGTVAGETAVVDRALISAADILINGDMSDAQTKYNDYKMTHEGCSDFEAYMYVAGDNMANSFAAYALAFVPGAILGGIKAESIINHQKNFNQNINFKEAFEGMENINLEPLDPNPSPDGWIAVTPKSGGVDVFGERGGYYGFRRFGDYDLMTNQSNNPNGISETDFVEEIQLSLDENGNVVQTVNKVYVGGSNNGFNQGSIQETKTVDIPTVTDQGSIQQIKTETPEIAANPAINVSNVVNNNIFIPGQSLSSIAVKNNDTYVSPFAPSIPKISLEDETDSTARTNWYRSTGAFTPEQLAIASKVSEIETNINNNDKKVTQNDFDYLYKQSKLPIIMKDRLQKEFEKKGLIIKEYASESSQDIIGNNENLYHIDTMPLSKIPKRQAAIDKLEKGEKLTLGDNLALGGRDHVVKEIDGYQLKPDHVYRVTDIKAWAEYVKHGKIVSNKPEFKIGENNGGVDWYLGGSASPTGKYSSGDNTIIIEAPADKKYFTPSIDNGLGMADDYHVRHMKSSTQANPVPLSMVKVIKGQDVIDNWESVESFKKNLGDSISSVTANKDNTFTVKTKYGKEFVVQKKGLNSQNFENEIIESNEEHENDLKNDVETTFYHGGVTSDFDKSKIDIFHTGITDALEESSHSLQDEIDSSYELSGINVKKSAFLSKVLGLKESIKSFTSGILPTDIKKDSTIDFGNRDNILINKINHDIKTKGEALVEIRNTSQLSLATLNEVSDLSKLKVRIIGGLDDGLGNFRSKYQYNKYVDRVTFTGYEAQAVIAKINELASQIDTKQSAIGKARQIYSLIAKEFKYDHEIEKYKDTPIGKVMHNIDAGLKGITDVNELNRQGLVCAGFAQLFYELCQRANIKCDYVRGIAYETDIYGNIEHDENGWPKYEPHAWNIIYNEEGAAIPVDVTWATDEKNKGMWFGKSKDFFRLHVPDVDENDMDYGSNVFNDLRNALSLLNMTNKKVSGMSPIEILKRYVKSNGDVTWFTRTMGIRNMICSISMNEIESFIRKYKSNSDFIKNEDTVEQHDFYDEDWYNQTLKSKNNKPNSNVPFSKIDEIRSYMNRNGITTIEDFMKSTGLSQVPPTMFKYKNIYATEKVYYDSATNKFSIKPVYNSRRMEITVSNDYLNDSINNASKRISLETFSDGKQYYVDTLTGSKIEDINFGSSTKGYKHTFYGEITRTNEGLSSSGGHILTSLILSRGSSKINITIPSDKSALYIINSGSLEIKITKIDPVTRLMDGTWTDTSRGVMAHNTTFWPAQIDAAVNKISEVANYSKANIETAIKDLGNTKPIAIQYKENLNGLTTVNVAYTGTYNGINYCIIREASGEVVTSYPLGQGASLRLSPKDGWISLEP